MAEGKGFSPRYDADERRVLAQGSTPEEWAVEVSRLGDTWITMFYVGAQGFRLARAEAPRKDGGEEHCMAIGRFFVQALEARDRLVRP
jgi:hypothetical protein